MLTVLTMLTMIYAISVLEWGRHVMLFKKAETGWTEKARSSSLPSLGKDRQLPVSDRRQSCQHRIRVTRVNQTLKKIRAEA